MYVNIRRTSERVKMKGKFGKFGPPLRVSLTGRDYETPSALPEGNQVSATWWAGRAIDEYLRRHQNETER